ncbi:MAG: response regulator [Magnetococcales bacterium]|nr:response regulator [Magnetococcales bacterium]
MTKVLIVDDELENCIVLERIFLECPGNPDLKTCHSGEEALTRMAAWQPDIIFMDLHLPGMDGIMTIKNMRQTGFSGKIVLMTGDYRSEHARNAARAGADGFLAKPVDGKYLCTIVASVVI